MGVDSVGIFLDILQSAVDLGEYKGDPEICIYKRSSDGRLIG